MDEPAVTRAPQVAQAVRAFEHERTGGSPTSVTVVLGGEALVVTLHGALPPAERALSQTEDGATLVRELHQAVFANAAGPLRQEIGRILEAEVREATVEVQVATGTLLLVFLLAGDFAAERWAEPAPAPDR